MTFKKRSSFVIMKSVLFALVLREMRTKFSSRRFGLFWLFFEPIAQISLMMALLYFRGRTDVNGIPFPMFLLTGMVPFFLMRGIMFRGMEAVNANRALFAYKQILPFDTVFARALIEVVLSSCVYVILLLSLGFFFGYDISIDRPLRWLGTLGVGIGIAFSFSLLFCMLIEVVPDSRTFLRILSLPLYILSGVLFPIWILPPDILDWMMWNPFLHIIDELRFSVFEYYPQHEGVNLVYPIKVTAITLFISLALYRSRRLKLVSL